MNEELIKLQNRLKELEQEKADISAQISSFQKAQIQNLTIKLKCNQPTNKTPTTPEEKRELFLDLFRCRKDIYPKRWENKTQDKKGYAPVCRNDWVEGVCKKRGKVKVKCGECPNQAFLPLDDQAIKSHLQGTDTLGTYAIREDDTCIFLACDFDGDGWEKDVLSYKNAAALLDIEVSVEISRSGNGAHAWLFFKEFISAKSARQLGTLILTKANENRPQMKLVSYDRFFPNQDYIPKGGFGNLIALPLQRQAREKNRTVFIDHDFLPINDQWEYLANVKRLSQEEVNQIVSEFYPKSPIPKRSDDSDDLQLIIDETIIEVNFSKEETLECKNDICITLDSKISISLEGMPSKVIAKIKKMATLSNPEFYRKNRMRLSTFGEPRLIFTGEMQDSQIIVPIGLKESVLELFRKANAKIILHDKRPRPNLIETNFIGELTPIQKSTSEDLLKYESGVLVAPPGAGKTVMACSMIAERKLPTLIIVNKEALLTQWKERLCTFLDLQPKQIGIIKGSRKKPLGIVDVAMMQTLKSFQDFGELPTYGQIIIDECHHIPCVTFEEILKRIPTQYILGLTATPYRKDRLEKIIYFYCGPIRHEITVSEQLEIPKIAKIKRTNFKLPEKLGAQPLIHLVWEQLIQNEERNNLIVLDILSCINQGRNSLIISDRKEHLKTLEEKAFALQSDKKFKIFKLESQEGKKKRVLTFEKIKEAILLKVPICLFATATLIGEGFDMPELDTLFLTMPLSFKGRMIQYAGRLHRSSEHKKEIIIHDYLDSNLALTQKMYKNRQKTYKSMGYMILEN